MDRALGPWLSGTAAVLAVACVQTGGVGRDAASRAAPVDAAAGETLVRETGVARGTDEAASEQAFRLALRRAVERAAEDTVDNGLDEAGMRIVREKLFKRPEQFVKSFRRAPPVVRDGTTSVAVEVVVKDSELGEEIAGIRRELGAARKPRLMVVVGPRGARGPSADALAVERAMAESFQSRGYKLVEGADVGLARAIYDAFRGEGDAAAARAAGTTGAEIVILGVASRLDERVTELDGAKLSFYRPSVVLRAVDTGSGRVVYSGERTGEESARAEGLSNAASDLAEECLRTVREEWLGSSRGLATMTVSVKGIDFPDFVRFRRMAETIPGVQLVSARPFAGDGGVLEIEHLRDPLDLVKALAEFKTPPLRLVGSNARSVDLEAAK